MTFIHFIYQPSACLGKCISVGVVHVVKFLQKRPHFPLFNSGLGVSPLPPWKIFLLLLLSCSDHADYSASQPFCFSSLALTQLGGERGHQAGDTWGAGARYSLTLLEVEGKSVGGKCQPSACDSGLGWELF